LGSFLVVLGVVFEHLGGSWGVFGGSWGIILGVLGALEVVLGRVDAIDAPKGDPPGLPGALLSVFSSILASQDDPKTTPRRPKIDQKIVSKNERRLGRERDFDPPEVPR